MVINKQNLSFTFMNKSFAGAVRRQNGTKYDLLTASTVSWLVFCLMSDYQYPVMNINYAGIYLTVKRTNYTCHNLQLWN